MTKFKYGVAAAALACAMGVAGMASAQDYDRLVVFGDSLSDPGNLALATAGAPGGPTPPPIFYPTGRFSNGPTYPELLGFDAEGFAGVFTDVAGSVNLAFGGAVSGRETRPGRPLGVTDQVDLFQALGGTFGAGDLVSLQGGANNIFQGFEIAVLDPSTAQAYMQGVAIGAATDMTTLTARIDAAGAGTILVSNLPNLGATPAFSPANVGAAGSQLATLTTTTFNSALLAGVGGVAETSDANIIYMDVYKGLEAVRANPAAFGLSNVTQPCFDDVALTVCSNPDDYLFYDSVHPTAAGHQLLAALAADYLYYGEAGAQSAVIGETGYRHREDALDASSARLSRNAPWASGTALSMSGGYDATETDARGLVGAAEAESYSVSLALETGPSDRLRFGAGVGIVQGDVDANPVTFDVETINFDAWAGWRSPSGMFANLTAGIANDSYDDFERQTALAPIINRADTGGTSAGAKLTLGTWFDMGGVALSPRAAISWISSDVDEFFETGGGATYAYADRAVEAINGEVALRLEGAMGSGLGFFAEGGYRDTLDDRSDDVIVAIAGSTADPYAATIEDAFGSQAIVNVGIEGRLFGPIQMEIGYRGRFGEHIDSHTGGLTLTLPLN